MTTATWLTLRFTDWGAVGVLFCMLTLCLAFVDRVIRWTKRSR